MSTAFNAKTAQCPGCGVPLEFKVGSARVVVCEYCSFAVARTDRGLENLGKLADLVPTGARLALRATGRYEGVDFEIVGRLQLEWQQGVWDEWYVALSDGRWGWLAEAAGHYYLSFRSSARPVAPRAALQPGRTVMLPGYGRLTVTDRKQAVYKAASGNLPEQITIGGSAPSVDLSGPNGLFATFDYADGDVPAVFVGREVTLESLRISTEHLPPPSREKIGADKLICPQCRAPVALQVPDQSMRVTCSHCNALLDVTQGSLRYLATMPERELRWQLGSRCTFFGVEYLAIGWMERECTVDGEVYGWEEWLLYREDDATYRFLVCSDGHWSFVTPISAGDVEDAIGSVRYAGNAYKAFSEVEATVSAVLGEFYWAVQQGERAQATDYVRPPEGISKEVGADEVNWSHAVYLSPAEVWAAFGSKERPEPASGVGSMQPNPVEKEVGSTISWAFGSAMVAFLLFVFFAVRASEKVVSREQLSLGRMGAPSGAVAQFGGAPGAEGGRGHVHVSLPFEITENYRNLEVALTSTVHQSWVYVSGALINETTNEVSYFDLESSYYSGDDWSEDERAVSTYLPSLPAGRYVLRTESEWEPGKDGPQIELTLTSGVPRMLHLVLVLLGLASFPALALYRQSKFEAARWEESNLSGGGDGDDGEEEDD